MLPFVMIDDFIYQTIIHNVNTNLNNNIIDYTNVESRNILVLLFNDNDKQ